MRFRLLVILCMLVAVTATAGCTRAGYYLQSVRGQLDLLAKREPIEQLIADTRTDAPLRQRLRTVLAMRDFASRELGLPDNGSYRSYADLGRQYVVWNVFAAPELSVEPRNWCFMFVGCLSYRGYFDAERARRFASRLGERGDDVYVAGIAAYSTLGHFDDPLLNTMLRGDDLYLAGVLFHELAHQQLYIRGDTEFNEAFASFVEEEGVRRWLQARGDSSQWSLWLQRQQRRDEFSALVGSTRERLRELYQSGLPLQQQHLRKQQIIAALRAEHEQLRLRDGSDTGYEAWFSGPLNNAQLASVATYRRYVPAFRDLFAQSGGNLVEFYEQAAGIGELPAPERLQLMERLLAAAAASGAHAAAEFVETPAAGFVTQ